MFYSVVVKKKTPV